MPHAIAAGRRGLDRGRCAASWKFRRCAPMASARADLPVLVEKAAQASSMKGNPIELTAEELREIISRALIPMVRRSMFHRVVRNFRGPRAVIVNEGPVCLFYQCSNRSGLFLTVVRENCRAASMGLDGPRVLRARRFTQNGTETN